MRSLMIPGLAILVGVFSGAGQLVPSAQGGGSPASVAAGVILPQVHQNEVVEVEIARVAIARAVENREPVDAGEEFPPDAERLFCFVEVRGAETETQIQHVWYWEGREMARIELPVRSARWRTWSSKRILEEWTGSWRVDILDMGGATLGSASFTVSAP